MLFNVGNDSPTLTGAKVTFTIDLEFPHNQRVLPSGDVVWAEDCMVNGKTPHTHTHSFTLLYSLYVPFMPLLQESHYCCAVFYTPALAYILTRQLALLSTAVFSVMTVILLLQGQSTASPSQFTPLRTLTGRLCFLMGHRLRRIKSQTMCLCGKPGVSEAVACICTHTYIWLL